MTRLLLMITAILALLGIVGATQSAAQAQRKAAPGSAPAQVKDRLNDAYKREFAFLESEKRALEKRLAEHEKRAKERASSASSDVAALQARVVAASGQAERFEELVLAAERDAELALGNEAVTEDILVMADAALKKGGIVMPTADISKRAELVSQLSFVFEQAPALLEKQAQVRIVVGDYFDGAGNKVDGQILRIGNIAAYGLADGARGPLAPAGELRLKLWPSDQGREVAGQLARGEAPSSLPMFLFESLESGVSPKVDKTVMDVIRTGGLIAWVIVGLGLAVLLMVLLRSFLLLRASRGGKRLLEPVLVLVEAGESERAQVLALSADNPTGRVLSATLGNLGLEREKLEDIVAEAILHEQPTLSRFGSSILVMAAVSPLLGLLGTVTGMISTFDVITEFGTGNPKLLSGGISEALVTTELGLIVAIPALLLGHVLSGWADSVRDHLDASALAAVNRSLGLKDPEPDGRDETSREQEKRSDEERAA